MRESNLKTIEDYQERIEFLENRLKTTVEILDYINGGEIEKAKNDLSHYYKESIEYIVLEALIIKLDTTKTVKLGDDKTFKFLKAIIESIPFPVFIKDENGKYLLINTLEANLFGLPESSIIGRHDGDFVKSEEEMEIIRDSDLDVLRNNWSIELPNQKFSLKDGKEYIFRTHKAPFINPITGRKNILGFSVDVTDSVNLKNLQNTFSKWSNPYL